MALIFHIDRLKEKHAQLEHSIALEYLRPLPDSNVIATLKHKKLLLKEEISRLAYAA